MKKTSRDYLKEKYAGFEKDLDVALDPKTSNAKSLAYLVSAVQTLGEIVKHIVEYGDMQDGD